MNKLILASAAALVTATLARAQTYVIAPDNAGLTQPSSSTLAWRDSTTGFRSQFIYDTTHFTNLGVTGPVLIQRMRFRAANASTSVGGSYPGNGTTTGVTLDIGTSLTDYTTPSLTFANNRGTMQNVMTWGTVTCAAGAGQTPNNYVIDIAIPGGFLYDPTLGQDLLLDITGSDFIGTIPTMSTGVSLAASRCNRVSNTPSTAATGTTSAGFCPVVIFDIIGAGGVPDNGAGFPLLVQGTATSYGTGCGTSSSRSFGELFPAAAGATLDLPTGYALAPNVPLAPTSYTVLPASGAAFFPNSGTQLLNNAATPAALTDDSLSQVCQLPFTFPYVGGSTTQVQADTNGYIVLQPTTAAGGDTTPTLEDLVGATAGTHAGLPRLSPLWYDLHPTRNTSLDPTAGLYFDVDTVNNKAYFTWKNFGEFATTTAGTKSFTFQVELSADGSVDVRYGSLSPFGSTTSNRVLGFSPGTPSPTPISTDLSVAIPFVTSSADSAPLALSATAPLIGATCTLTTRWVPAPGILLNWISSVQVNPGLDLGGLGITGCNANVDPSAAISESLTFGVGTVNLAVPVPSSVALVSLVAYTQSAALAPGFNAFGAVTSNGVRLSVGTVP